MQATVISSLAEVSAADWNRLLPAGGEPFLRHEFLLALEASGATGPGTGWQARHLLLRDAAGTLCGAMPLYLKTDSWGEFVFDWSWADAYRRAGLHYYPKLVAAIPFTPASGPRWLSAPGHDADEITTLLLTAARSCATQLGCSSLHVLFPPVDSQRSLQAAGMALRKDCQFHWHNRGWSSFDDFLDSFTAAKRKKARRERRRVQEQGIHFEWLNGHQLHAGHWAEILPLYASTFWRRGREPYLPGAFFERISQTLPDNLLVILARQQERAVGTAICFRSNDTLYGRYWGAAGDWHSLHFETCYYQGIDYCIEHGLARFEPGTQGEHKISRGFVPAATWSAHWLSHPQFLAAVDEFVERERHHIDRYMELVDEHVPYRRDPS